MRRLQHQLDKAQQALAQATQENQQFKALLNHLPAMIGFWDTAQINRFANQAYLDWLGLAPSEIDGRHLSEVLGPQLYALNRPFAEKALAGQAQSFERVITNPRTGAQRTSMANYLPHLEDGVVRGFYVQVTDVSAQKETELALLASEKVLREREQRYRNVVMDQTELISRLRADGSYLFANAVFCRFFGKQLHELMGATWTPLVHPDDKDRVVAELKALSFHNPVVMIENRVIGGDGQTCWMQFSNRGFFDANGTLLEIQSVGRDISQRKEAETQLRNLNAALTASHQLLRALGAHNETRLENERKHFSREVHDELGQVLTALRMELLVIEMRFCGQNQELCEKVQEMKATLDQAFEAVRNVAAHLRPPALDLGLSEALRWLCAEFSRKSGVPCSFETHNTGLPDETVSVVLFRIVQESLTNIARYAHAAQVQVRLEWAEAALLCSVQDNGVGFDKTRVPSSTCYGLLGMQERALALGGEVHILSAPGQGTQVRVRIPWQPALAGAAP
jgi:PAS domain S-box-containing protein